MVYVFYQGGITEGLTILQISCLDEQVRMGGDVIKRNVYSTNTSTGKNTR